MSKGIRKGVQQAMQGGLSKASGSILVQNLDETVLMGQVGVPVEQLNVVDATLVSVVLDMSGSMAPHRKSVADAYNEMLSALSSARHADSILVSTWAFNDRARCLRGYEPVASSKPLGKHYDPNGLTALYDTLLNSMAQLVAYGQQLTDHGVPNQRILFVLSDGMDTSSRSRAKAVKTVANDLLRQEVYTLAYAGFGGTDLACIAGEVGFPSVITTGATKSDLRRIFRQVSQSVIHQASAGGASAFFT